MDWLSLGSFCEDVIQPQCESQCNEVKARVCNEGMALKRPKVCSITEQEKCGTQKCDVRAQYACPLIAGRTELSEICNAYEYKKCAKECQTLAQTLCPSVKALTRFCDYSEGLSCASACNAKKRHVCQEIESQTTQCTSVEWHKCEAKVCVCAAVRNNTMYSNSCSDYQQRNCPNDCGPTTTTTTTTNEMQKQNRKMQYIFDEQQKQNSKINELQKQIKKIFENQENIANPKKAYLNAKAVYQAHVDEMDARGNNPSWASRKTWKDAINTFKATAEGKVYLRTSIVTKELMLPVGEKKKKR